MMMQGGPRIHPLAIISLVAGILSIPTCCCFGIGIPFGIAAIVCGIIAMGKAKANPELYKGNGLAIAGIICGSLGMLSGIGSFFTTLDDSFRSKYGNY